MANKKQSKSVVTGSTRVLRPRTPTTGDAKVDERGKIPEASGKLKIRDAEKSEIVMKRKVMDHAAGSRAKIVKAINKNEMDKGAAGGSTRVLRSSSAKKGDEAGKKAVMKYAKAKALKETLEAKMSFDGEGSCSLTTDFTGPESAGKRLTRSATKGQVAVQASAPTRKNPMRKGQAVAKTNW